MFANQSTAAHCKRMSAIRRPVSMACLANISAHSTISPTVTRAPLPRPDPVPLSLTLYPTASPPQNLSGAIMVAPSQYQATRLLEQVCDLRVSISPRDYVDSDRWGRGSQPGPRFSTRAAAQRALRSLTMRASRPRLPAPPKHPALTAPPAAEKYPQPPAPPPHVLLHDNNSASPMPRTRDSSFAERVSEPPSFGNLREFSSASSRPRTPVGMRRPRGNSSSSNQPHNSAALADYLELNDEVVVERVFDDSDEPLSATSAGGVASVPQSPHNRTLYAPIASSRTSPPSKVSYAPDDVWDAELTQPAAPEIALVPLRSEIPDRPRPHDPWAEFVEDDGVAYFEDVGDVAPADASEPAKGRTRPKLREHVFTTIKSYHHTNLGFDDDDDDDYADDTASDSTVNSAHTDRSGALQQYLRKPVQVMHADEVFEESDISHSFDAAPAPLAGSRGFASRAQTHRRSAMSRS